VSQRVFFNVFFIENLGTCQILKKTKKPIGCDAQLAGSQIGSGKCPGETSDEDVWIPMQDYKSLRDLCHSG